MVFHGDFLGAQVFFGRNGKPRSRLDRRIIGHDDHQPAGDVAEFDDDTARWTSTVFLIHFIPSKCPQFKLRSIRIQKVINALPSRHLSLFVELRNAFGPSTSFDLLCEAIALRDEQTHFIFVAIGIPSSLVSTAHAHVIFPHLWPKIPI